MPPPLFGARTVLDIIEPLLVIPDRADPLDSLDAWMAAVNLAHLLLRRDGGAAANPTAFRPGHAVLPDGKAAALRRERLVPLDRAVRARMDVLWAEIGLAEKAMAAVAGAASDPHGGKAAEGLAEMRMSFTHLHVAATVTAAAAAAPGAASGGGAA